MTFSSRRIRDDDLETIMRWRMDPDITKWMNTDPRLTLEGQRDWLARIEADDTSRYWMIEVDGRRAGVLSLVDIDFEAGVADWGYYVGERSLRSMQLAISLELSLYAHCFEDLGLRKVVNAPHADNVATIRLHELCGNRVVGVRKGALMKHGSAIDLVDMEITAEDWYAKAATKPFERIWLA